MVGFVILNYNSYNDTLTCIDCLKKIKGSKKILVVDNNTLSSEQIKKIKENTVDLLLLKDNYGYAVGNNKGCDYLLKKYKKELKYIFILNSDVIINDELIINKINDIYKETNFDILGPKILPEDSDSCNPFPVLSNLDDVNNYLAYLNRLLKIYKSPVIRKMLEIYLDIKYAFIKKKSRAKNGDKRIMNVALHGCAIIFSQNYFNQFSEIFYPGTFLFHEEEFLYYRIKNRKLISVYDPSIEVIHLEEQSLKCSHEGKYKKMIFKINEQINSLEKLKTLMSNNYEWGE